MSTEEQSTKKTSARRASSGQAAGKGKATARPRKKAGKRVEEGTVHILATFNNTVITITDPKGNALVWSSAGQNFKGSRKSTPFAAQLTSDNAAKAAYVEFGMRKVQVFVKGPGTGREAAIKALIPHFTIIGIKDVTPLAHGGTRPSKRRRV